MTPYNLCPSSLWGRGGPKYEQGLVLGGGAGDRKGALGRRGGGGRVTFYFDGKGKEEDSPSESENDLDSSEDEWGKLREYAEDAEKEKKIKMAPVVFTMAFLDFVLDDIKPLGFLRLVVERWEAYYLRGAGEALRSVNNNCFVVCEVWDDRDRKRNYIALRDANVPGTPCDDVLSAMEEHPNF